MIFKVIFHGLILAYLKPKQASWLIIVGDSVDNFDDCDKPAS
jgi:hypothetical protein